MCSPKISMWVFVVLNIVSVAANASSLLLGYDYDVRTSSTLTDEKMSYPASNLIPPSLSNSWCEGGVGNGIGESVELTLKQPVSERVLLAIQPGYAKNKQLYINNGRPKIISLLINGRIEQEIEFKDQAKEQVFKLNIPSGEKLHNIKMTILDVYPGSKYEDTCITEILLLPVIDPKKIYSDKEINKEASNINLLFDKAKKGSSNAIEMLVRMSGGPYIRTAEGGEWLYEIYLELYIHDPYRFLYIALKQNDEIMNKTLDAIIDPVIDRYSKTQLLDSLDKAIKKGIDPSSVEFIREAIKKQ